MPDARQLAERIAADLLTSPVSGHVGTHLQIHNASTYINGWSRSCIVARILAHLQAAPQPEAAKGEAEAEAELEELRGMAHYCPDCGEGCKACQCYEKKLAAAEAYREAWEKLRARINIDSETYPQWTVIGLNRWMDELLPVAPQEPKAESEPIPAGIYYSDDADAFYELKSARNQGDDFWLKWRDRSGEFPEC